MIQMSKEKEPQSYENCPWLIFRLNKRLYAINSSFVGSITTFPENPVSLPQDSPAVRGVFPMRGKFIALLDLRILFGVPSLKEEYEKFASLLEIRKQEHLQWVTELERSYKNNEPFTLATDPHKCAFGKWYDSFETDIVTIQHHMKKIESPHTLLHQTAREVEKWSSSEKEEEKTQKLNEIFDRLHNVYVPEIVSLLDKAKELFQLHFQEMIIILEREDRHLAIVVDEIMCVEQLNEICDSKNMESFHNTRFIAEFRKSKELSENIMILNESAIFDAAIENNIVV